VSGRSRSVGPLRECGLQPGKDVAARRYRCCLVQDQTSARDTLKRVLVHEQADATPSLPSSCDTESKREMRERISMFCCREIPKVRKRLIRTLAEIDASEAS
jgi:hypothetical protein